jgi:hypothetical protein
MFVLRHNASKVERLAVTTLGPKRPSGGSNDVLLFCSPALGGMQRIAWTDAFSDCGVRGQHRVII